MKSKVSLVSCKSYDDVLKKVRQSVDLLGGMESFVEKGERVLIKPNLLRPATPDSAIVTHPSIVAACVILVKEAGGHPVIFDSPGGPLNQRMLNRAYEKAGLIEVARETGAKLLYNTKSSIVPFPSGKLIKAFEVMDEAVRADAVITLPKLKTHTLTYLTGATKILFGIVPGLSKAAYHAKLTDVDNFSTMLLDLLQLVQPRLSIMDAVVGMDGNGPSGGNPKKIGAIISGEDHIAVDVVASSLVGFNPLEVQTIKAAVKMGKTSGKLGDIEIIGDNLNDLSISDFTPPAKAARPWFMPNSIEKIMKWQLTPYPRSNSDCVACGVCKTNCPVNAITIKGRAFMNLSKCIRCYCCHETCPHKAIDIRKPVLLKIIENFR